MDEKMNIAFAWKCLRAAAKYHTECTERLIVACTDIPSSSSSPSPVHRRWKNSRRFTSSIHTHRNMLIAELQWQSRHAYFFYGRPEIRDVLSTKLAGKLHHCIWSCRCIDRKEYMKCNRISILSHLSVEWDLPMLQVMLFRKSIGQYFQYLWKSFLLLSISKHYIIVGIH